MRSGDQDARQKDLNARQRDLRAKQNTSHHHGEYFSNWIRVGAPTNQPDASKTKKHFKQSPRRKPDGSKLYRPPIGGLEPLIGGPFSPGSVQFSVARVLVYS